MPRGAWIGGILLLALGVGVFQLKHAGDTPSVETLDASRLESTPQGAVASSAEEPPPSPAFNSRRPYSVALAALQALKEQDFEGLLSLVPPSRVDRVRERWGPGTPRYMALFGAEGWQQQSLEDWDGLLIEVRQRRGMQVLAKYGVIMDGGTLKHVVVSLLNYKGDGRWFFKDLDARMDLDFNSYGAVVEEAFELPLPPVGSQGTQAGAP